MKPSLAALYVSVFNFTKFKRVRDLHVEDTVSDDLGIDRDLVDSLTESPDDRVSGPEAVSSVWHLFHRCTG